MMASKEVSGDDENNGRGDDEGCEERLSGYDYKGCGGCGDGSLAGMLMLGELNERCKTKGDGHGLTRSRRSIR